MRVTGRMAGGALAVLVAGLAASACSSTPSATKGTTSTTAGHHAGTHHAGTHHTSSSSSTTTSTTAAPAVTTCQASGLSITVSGNGGAAGTEELTFSLTNTTTAPCKTYGYPGMLLLSTSGAPEPTTVVRGGRESFEKFPPARVEIKPGGSAYFNVGFEVVPVGTTSCSTAHKVEITPPTNQTHATVNVPDLVACDNGTLHVSPVFGSTDTSATQTTAPPLPSG